MQQANVNARRENNIIEESSKQSSQSGKDGMNTTRVLGAMQLFGKD
jgi:hypothetical protein